MNQAQPRNAAEGRPGRLVSISALAFALIATWLGGTGSAAGVPPPEGQPKPASPDPAPVRFVTPEADDKIAVATDGTSAHLRLWIETTGEEALENVLFTVTPLRTDKYGGGGGADDSRPDPTEVDVAVTVGGDPWTTPRTVDAGELIAVELRADLPLADTYRGVATLEYEGGRLPPRAVELTRSTRDSSVEAHGLATSDGVAEIWLSLREKGVADVEVGRPRVLKLERKVGADGRVQARFDSLSVAGVEDRSSGWLSTIAGWVRVAVAKLAPGTAEEPAVEGGSPTGDEPAAATGVAGAGRADSRVRHGDDFLIRRGESLRLLLGLGGLSEPGDYVGTLLVPVRDAESLREEFQLSVRRSVWCAVFWISLGVLFAVLLDHLIKTVRPRLLRLRRVALLERDLRRIVALYTLREEESAVAGRIEGELTDLAGRADFAATADFDEALKLPDARLTLFGAWLQARRFVDGLEAPFGAAFEALLADTERLLRKRSPTVDDINAATAKLEDLDAKVRAERKKKLVGEIEATGKEAQGLIDGFQGSPDDKAELVRRIEVEVTTALAQATTRLAADPPDRLDLEAARRLWQSAAGALEKHATSTGGQVSAALTSRGLARLGALSTLRPHRGELRLETIGSLLRNLDWVVILLTAGVSVVLGIQLLWVPDPAWGSVGDILVAVLWGLGLQQVGSAAAGYVGVRKKLAGEGA